MTTHELGGIIEKALVASRAGILAAFLTVTAVPADALAVSHVVSNRFEPQRFVRDTSLLSEALDGMDLAVRGRVSGALTADAWRIPATASRPRVGLELPVLATAYSSTPDQTDSSPLITASGSHVGYGTMAANWLPLGTRVLVNGAPYTVLDRMNSRFNNTYMVDVWQAGSILA